MTKKYMPRVDVSKFPRVLGSLRAEDGIPAHIDELLAKRINDVVRATYEAEGADFVELGKVMKDAVADHNARLQQVEQIVAKGQTTGSIQPAGNVSAMGQAVQRAAQNDVVFGQLQNWNQASARFNLDGVSIRGALVNDPYNPSPTDNGSMPSQPDRWGIFGPVMAQPRLLNFLPSRSVSSDSVEYVKLSTTGDVDYQDGEGTEKAEIDFDGTPHKAYIATIAGFTTASRQVLSDHATLSQHIDTVLRAKLMNKLSYEIINGQGGSDTKIEGLLEQGLIMTLPNMTNFADRVGEAIVRQGNLGFRPGLIAMNPQTWLEEIATAKTATEQTYMFGSPANPLPPALWNLPVALEPSIPEGYAMVMDLSYVTVLDRERVSVMVSNSHADYFRRNLIAILGELRAGLEVLDEGAVMIVEPISSTTN